MTVMGKTAEKVQRVTLSTLKQRGWTDGAVKQFLGEPDTLAPNPNYRSGPQMRLYNLERVEAAEVSGRWQDWREATKARREKASTRQTERMNTARANLIAELNAAQISVPRLSKDKLWRVAVDNRNAQAEWHAAERGRYESHSAAVDSVDSAALQRWAVNYLRHVETDYDWLLDSVAGRVGVAEARRLIRERVLRAIADQYPYLAGECARQESDR